MGQRVFLVGFAMLIDAFGIVVVLFTTALGASALGVAGGCALGAQYAGQVGCQVGATLGGIIAVFAQATGAGVVVGALLGYVIDVCITLSFGVMLVTLLMYTGHMSLKNFLYTAGVFILEMLPMLGLAPAWSVYTWNMTADTKKDKLSGADTQPYAQTA